MTSSLTGGEGTTPGSLQPCESTWITLGRRHPSLHRQRRVLAPNSKAHSEPTPSPQSMKCPNLHNHLDSAMTNLPNLDLRPLTHRLLPTSLLKHGEVNRESDPLPTARRSQRLPQILLPTSIPLQTNKNDRRESTISFKHARGASPRTKGSETTNCRVNL